MCCADSVAACAVARNDASTLSPASPTASSSALTSPAPSSTTRMPVSLSSAIDRLRQCERHRLWRIAERAIDLEEDAEFFGVRFIPRKARPRIDHWSDGCGSAHGGGARPYSQLHEPIPE